MSLGKRQHEIWTKGASGRVNKKDTIKEDKLNKKKHQNKNCKHQKLLITTLLVTGTRDSSRKGLSEGKRNRRAAVTHVRGYKGATILKISIINWYKNTLTESLVSEVIQLWVAWYITSKFLTNAIVPSSVVVQLSGVIWEWISMERN